MRQVYTHVSGLFVILTFLKSFSFLFPNSFQLNCKICLSVIGPAEW